MKILKNYLSVFVLFIIFILPVVGCGKKEKHEIEILVPAGSTEDFVYSEAEIRPIGNKITIWSGAGLSDTEVILKPVEVKQENSYEPTYLTHGMSVKMDVEKGGWFKIGVSVQNDSDRGPIAVSVEVEGVEVRMAERVAVKEQHTLNEEIALSTDSFWKSITEIVFYDFNEDTYKVSDATQLEELYAVFKNLTYKEIENPWLEGWYMFKIHTKQNTYDLGISGKTISFNGKFYKVTDSISKEVIEIMKSESHVDEETIFYNGKEYKTSELCNATLKWLELSEKERMLSSYFPPEFIIFDEKWGVSLAVENITPSGAIIKCTQSGGEPTGELHTDSWYILENWTQENGWKEIPYIIDGEIGRNDIAWMIPMEDTLELEVNWEWLYGKLPDGKYRIGKSITDFRETGDFDTATYFAEFEILK